MKFSYNKDDKLKQKTAIDALFNSGLSVSQYPLRLVFISESTLNNGTTKLAVSVSKRNFKKAVDRNKIKRLIREAYRLNKPEINDVIKTCCKNGLHGMILYNGNEIPDFKNLQKCMTKLWLKFELKMKS